MTAQRTVPPRRSRLESVAVHWWEAVSGGRFFSPWTLLASGIVAVLILSPYLGLASPAEHVAAMVASFLAWALIVAVVLPLAVLERRLTTRAARGVLVLGTVAIATVARPFLNDALATLLFGFDSTGAWLQRIATNGLTWFILLPLVAAAAAWYADATSSAARLAAALAVFDDLQHRIRRYGEGNQVMLSGAVADLRARRDALLAAPVDFDAVRDFADDVRATSHRLDDRLHTPLDHRSGYALSTAGDARPTDGRLARLARPPALLIAIVYFVASAPYTFVVGGALLVVEALLLLVFLSLAADLATRLLGRGRTPTVQGVVLVVSWILVGVAMTVAGAVLSTGHGVVLFVPLVAVPGLAVVVALSTDALQRTRRHTATLTQLLGTTSALATARTAQAREPLWRAVDLLHDRVQAKCVIFAARADERPPTSAEIDTFRADTDAAFDEILAGAPGGAIADDLDGLLATWSGVLEIQAEIDADALTALQSPAVAAGVTAAVGEGLVNAVKHSAARAARLTVVGDAAGETVTVTIASTGTLRSTGAAGLGLASFGGRARLRQVGDDVVLDVVVPIAGGAGRSGPPDAADLPTRPVRLPSR